MIQYKIELGEDRATVTVADLDEDGKGPVEVEGSGDIAASIRFALEYQRFDPDGHLIPPGPMLPMHLDHIIKMWNLPEIAEIEVIGRSEHVERGLPQNAVS